MKTRALLVAPISVAFSAALAAWEAFRPHTHPAEEATPAGHEDSLLEYLVVLGIIGVATIVVFGVVVRRGLKKESAAPTALVLSTLGVLTVFAFWSGLPPVLAGGGIVLGWSGRNAERRRWVAWTAIGLGVFALAADIVAYLGDTA